MAFSTTKNRVPDHTAVDVNQRIEDEMEDRVRKLALQPEKASQRINDLEAEWDIERAIETNASILAFLGVALGFFVHPYWLALPALVTLFLFQHALQGWCPPVPVLRRMGFRTVYEIEKERQALKLLKGDFKQVESAPDKAKAALRAVD